MSFTIEIQKNNSERNKIGKDISTITTMSGTLKNATSIINPVILVECDLDDLYYSNYLTIGAFGRSYFINNITSVASGLVEISAHVDVLESFKDEILSNRAITAKQEKEWNVYLDDGTFKAYQNPMIVTKEFPNAFSAREYVLAVAGG